jgi:transcriptional regulator with XRE-family HTH domain
MAIVRVMQSSVGATEKIDHDTDRAVGQRIKELREKHRWSQADFAAHLAAVLGHRRDASAISRAETGQRTLSPAELRGIALVFGVKLDALLPPISKMDDYTLGLLNNWAKARHFLEPQQRALRDHYAGCSRPVRAELDEMVIVALSTIGADDPTTEARRVLGTSKRRKA